MMFIRLLIIIKKKTWKRNTFQTTGAIHYGTEYYINIKSQNLEKYLINREMLTVYFQWKIRSSKHHAYYNTFTYAWTHICKVYVHIHNIYIYIYYQY